MCVCVRVCVCVCHIFLISPIMSCHEFVALCKYAYCSLKNCYKGDAQDGVGIVQVRILFTLCYN